MTKEQFNNIDLRKQLTDDLKSKWYFKQFEWGLKIYKHCVVFDKDFKFRLVYHPEIIADETKDVVFEGQTYHIEKGEVLSDAYIDIRDEDNYRFDLYFEDNYYSDDEYLDNPKDILEHILLYIANCI